MTAISGILRREFERNSQEYGYYLGQITRKYLDGEGENVASVDHYTDQVDALTADMLQQAAEAYLSLKNYVEVRQVPENSK
jgi:hypothetical protein